MLSRATQVSISLTLKYHFRWENWRALNEEVEELPRKSRRDINYLCRAMELSSSFLQKIKRLAPYKCSNGITSFTLA